MATEAATSATNALLEAYALPRTDKNRKRVHSQMETMQRKHTSNVRHKARLEELCKKHFASLGVTKLRARATGSLPPDGDYFELDLEDYEAKSTHEVHDSDFHSDIRGTFDGVNFSMRFTMANQDKWWLAARMPYEIRRVREKAYFSNTDFYVESNKTIESAEERALWLEAVLAFTRDYSSKCYVDFKQGQLEAKFREHFA